MMGYEQITTNLNGCDGQKTADIRVALVEHFRGHGTVISATEAGDGDFNLLFCALLRRDLPPRLDEVEEQRNGLIEEQGSQLQQRIGKRVLFTAKWKLR